MARRRTRSRRLSAAVLAGLLGVLAPAGIAAAAPEGRIQQVESTPGQVTFLFSAAGLASGQQVDAGSVKVTVDGQALPAQARSTSQTVDGQPAIKRQALLVIDTSGSMAESGKMAAAKSAARAFLTAVPADVSVGLVTFADQARVAVAPTTDRAAVTAAVNGLAPKGATAMYDATALAVKTLGTDGARSIVLLSDGQDEGSTTTAARAAKVVRDSGVALDAVSLGAGTQAGQLAALARAGGGTLVTKGADALGEAFASAARTMSSQLAVTVQVPDTMQAGTAALTATVNVDGAPVSDQAVAEVIPPAVDPAGAGPREVDDPMSGFWTSPLLLGVAILAVFVALLTIGGLAVNTIDPSQRTDGRIRRRLAGLDTLAQRAEARPTAPPSALGSSTAVRNAVSVADKVVTGTKSDALEAKLQTAGVPLRSSEWVVLHALIAVGVGSVAALASGLNLVIGFLGLVIGAALPWLFLGLKSARRQQRFYEQLPDTMQLLAGSLTAGYSLPQALDSVARESGGPMAQELQRALMETRLGIPIEDSLAAVATRMRSKDFSWVVMAIAMNRKVGGNLADVLRTVGATLRERERLRRQVKALAAEGKLSAWVLALMPFGLIAYMATVSPGYLSPLITNPLGWIMIAIGAVAMGLGLLWLSKLVKIEV